MVETGALVHVLPGVVERAAQIDIQADLRGAAVERCRDVDDRTCLRGDALATIGEREGGTEWLKEAAAAKRPQQGGLMRMLLGRR